MKDQNLHLAVSKWCCCLTLSSMLMLTSSLSAVTAADLPPNHHHHHHPTHPTLVKFSQHFRCPYANEWVTKGPKQAIKDLGLEHSFSKVVGNNKNHTATVMVMNDIKFSSTTTSSSFVRRGDVHHHHHQQRRRRGRYLQDDSAAAEAEQGHCTYTNSFTGTTTCLEFRGPGWTTTSMEERCNSETDPTFTNGSGCVVIGEDETTWCIVPTNGMDDNTIEATPMIGDCNQNQMACESFMNGSFEPSSRCLDNNSDTNGNNNVGGGGSSTSDYPMDNPTTDGPVTCTIAPGAIGAGHQAGYSTGYSPVCPDTPAEGSPYMWPMAWTANVESKSMAYGSDDIWYHSKGIVSYRLDKNWKRQDWYYQRGIQRSIGQAPCDPENIDTEFSDGPLLACRRDSDEYSTMIHRGSKMFFISWKNGTEVGTNDPSQISECNWLDLQVIGNIRPDWFMDDRGDSTDVQYLGDQHVFYDGEPRLVKQWRKKDFANQYFVMSMLGNPKDDGIHWPMILNVPGEGFGDDFLQIYTNQSSLTDEDDYLFLLDEAFEAINGSCPQMQGFGDGEAGPPTDSDVHIPSNLEVEDFAWFSNVYTFSPVWEPPVDEDTNSVSNAETAEMAVTTADRVIVKSCYDESMGGIRLSMEFTDIDVVDGSDMIPWMALGYRETEECLMNPRSGNDTQIVLISQSSPDESAQAYLGSLPRAARGMTNEAISSIYATLTPLAETESYSDVFVQTPLSSSSETTSIARNEPTTTTTTTTDSVMLDFFQFMDKTRISNNPLYLMYAIGSTSQLGFHATRNCFEVTEFPMCNVNGGQTSSNDVSSGEDVDSAATTTNASTSNAGRNYHAFIFSMVGMVGTSIVGSFVVLW